MKIATIARNPIFSPQMSENDAAILHSVERELAMAGASVRRFGENEEIGEEYRLVLHMSRTAKTLRRLKKYEEQGRTVINSAQAVANCSRKEFMRILQEHGIKQPPFQITGQATPPPTAAYPAWIKRADGWACHKEDVVYAANREEAETTLKNMMARGCSHAVVCDHAAGDIIKFYGVGEGFFRYGYPDIEKTKFGLEKINGTPKGHPVDAKKLHAAALGAAAAVGLTIFGGDAVITSEGEIFIIDINDFPSFSSIRDEAAREIAKLIYAKYKNI